MTMMMSSTATPPMFLVQQANESSRSDQSIDGISISVQNSLTKNDGRYFSTAVSTTTMPMKPFPSLLLGANGSITASGSFAESQKVFLQPDTESVNQIAQLLRRHQYRDCCTLLYGRGIAGCITSRTTTITKSYWYCRFIEDGGHGGRHGDTIATTLVTY